MKKTKISFKLATGLLLSVIMLISAMPASVFASKNVPVTIEIPITYIVRGNDKVAGGDWFVLTPDDPEAPMPEDAEDGEKRIRIKREGAYSFGEIYYDRPEVWWYTVTREATKKKGVTKDTSEFRVKVIALNDGHGYVLVYQDDEDEKTELVYVDSVAPATGDTNMVIYLGTAFAAAAVVLLFISLRKRERRE